MSLSVTQSARFPIPEDTINFNIVLLRFTAVGVGTEGHFIRILRAIVRSGVLPVGVKPFPAV